MIDSKALKREVGLMQKLSSDYVVNLVDTVSTTNSYYLLLELCNGCDLTTLRAQRGGYLPEKEARVII
jgi:serine/threonine protein kinase